MKVEAIPKELLDMEIRKGYQHYKGFERYREELDAFYRNFEVLTLKDYRRGDKEEINNDIDIVNRRSRENIFKKRKSHAKCNLMICDNLCFFRKDLEGYFDSFPTMDFAKLKKYSRIVLVDKIDINLTCADTRYEPITIGYLITD